MEYKRFEDEEEYTMVDVPNVHETKRDEPIVMKGSAAQETKRDEPIVVNDQSFEMTIETYRFNVDTGRSTVTTQTVSDSSTAPHTLTLSVPPTVTPIPMVSAVTSSSSATVAVPTVAAVSTLVTTAATVEKPTSCALSPEDVSSSKNDKSLSIAAGASENSTFCETDTFVAVDAGLTITNGVVTNVANGGIAHQAGIKTGEIPKQMHAAKDNALPVIGMTFSRRGCADSVMVLSVDAKGLAHQAGIRVGDKLTRVNGVSICDTKSYVETVRHAVAVGASELDFTTWEGTHKCVRLPGANDATTPTEGGTDSLATIDHASAPLCIDGSLPSHPQTKRTTTPTRTPSMESPVLSTDLPIRFGLTILEGEECVRIDAMTPGSVADKAGFQVGDEFTHLNGIPVPNLNAWNSAKATVLRGKEEYFVFWLRNGGCKCIAKKGVIAYYQQSTEGNKSMLQDESKEKMGPIPSGTVVPAVVGRETMTLETSTHERAFVSTSPPSPKDHEEKTVSKEKLNEPAQKEPVREEVVRIDLPKETIQRVVNTDVSSMTKEEMERELLRVQLVREQLKLKEQYEQYEFNRRKPMHGTNNSTSFPRSYGTQKSSSRILPNVDIITATTE